MRITLLALLFMFTAACSKKSGDDPKAKMAGFCTEAVHQLEITPSKSDDTFRMQVSNVLDACSSACDRGDQASCTTLDTQVGKLCGRVRTLCEKLCEPDKKGSLTDVACKHAKE
jgi:hypothetical protein